MSTPEVTPPHCSQDEQKGIGEEIPGAIPNRKPTVSELVELKIMIRDCKFQMLAVFGAVKTLNLEKDFPLIGTDIDRVGYDLDDIGSFVQRTLKKTDEKKKAGAP